jgi:hypothetical protein
MLLGFICSVITRTHAVSNLDGAAAVLSVRLPGSALFFVDIIMVIVRITAVSLVR